VPSFNEKNNDTKDYSEQLEFLNSEAYYASKKIVNQSSDFPVRRTGSYRHKKALISRDSRVVFIEYLRGQSIDLMIGPVAFPFNDLADFRPRFLGTFPGVSLAQPPRTVARNGGSDTRSDRVGLGSSPDAHQTIPAPQLCLDSRADVRRVDRQTTLHA